MASIFSGKKLAVTLGGNAAERSISLESGGNVAQILEQSGASVLRIDPSETGWLEQLAEAVDAAFVEHDTYTLFARVMRDIAPL